MSSISKAGRAGRAPRLVARRLLASLVVAVLTATTGTALPVALVPGADAAVRTPGQDAPATGPAAPDPTSAEPGADESGLVRELPSTPTIGGPGAYIIDMGQSTQTVGNQLKPYGMIFDLVVNHRIPVDWAINETKTKAAFPTPATDGPDFTITDPAVGGTKTYKGGPFIIPASFGSAAAATVALWRTRGVVVDGPITTPFTYPRVSTFTITSWPKVVLDAQNGSIAAGFYANAGIPNTTSGNAFLRFGTPASLTTCDDMYVMPHADPTWATHQNLITFNANGGYIWAACHAVSVLENIYNPATGNPTPVMNFLSLTGLVPYGSHSDGSPPYTYTAPGTGANQGMDPVMQFLGPIDLATTNGSEQVFLPKLGGGWRPTTSVLAWDATQADVPTKSPGVAAALVYGRGFGVSTNGLVMYEGGHTLAKATGPDNLAAQRAFFNFMLLSAAEHNPTVTVAPLPSTLLPGATVSVSGSATGGSGTYSYRWESDCGGTFANPNAASTTFTAPSGGTSAMPCNIKLVVTDDCGRVGFGTASTVVEPPADLAITKTLVSPVPNLVAGSNATYTLAVRNNGPGLATGVAVVDTVPAGMSLVSATPSSGTCASQGSTVSCNLTPGSASLAVGATASVTLVVAIAAAASGTLANTATVSGTQTDTVPGNNTATASAAVIRPAIALQKTTGTPAVRTGQTASYAYVVTNPGNDPLSAVVVSDDKCSPLVAAGGDIDLDGKLDPGESWTFTCSTTLSADTTNTATAVGLDSNGTSRSAQSTAFVDVIAPGLAIAKSPASQTVALGGTAWFVITVTNSGDGTLANVVVSDPLAPACSTTIPSLPEAATIQYTCALTNVTASFTNTVGATGTDEGGGTVNATPATASVTVGIPVLTVTKTPSPTVVRPGETIDWTIVVTNTGNVTQNNVTLSDPVPANTSWVSTQLTHATVSTITEDFTSGCYSGGTGWNGDWIEVGETTGCTANDVRVEDNSSVAGVNDALRISREGRWIYRQVNLSGRSAATLTLDWARRDVDPNRSVSIEVSNDGTSWTAIGNVNTTGAVGKTDDAAFSQATYTIPAGFLTATSRIRFMPGATNAGSDRFFFDNIILTAVGTPTTVAGGPMPNLTSVGGPYVLVPGQSLTAVVRVLVNEGISPSVTSVANAATATGTSTAVGVGEADVIVPSLAITKSVSTGGGPQSESVVVRDGTQVTYHIAVTNDGTDVLSGVAVTDDPVCDGLARIGGDTNSNNLLDPGETWLYTCTSTPSASVTDTATVNADDSGGSPVDPESDTASVQVFHPMIDVSVVVDQPIVRPGTTVNLTYAVTNPGDAALESVELTDATCPSGLLQGPVEITGSGDAIFDPGEIWQYTCVVTATADFSSLPSVAGDDPLGDPVTASDSVSVDVISPAISLVKSTTAVDVVPGTTVTYTFGIANTGDDPLTGVTLFDDDCGTPTYVSGDDGDSVLEVGETWGYTCDAVLTQDTTNVAVATGDDSLGAELQTSDTAFVNVLSSHLLLGKTGSSTIAHVGSTVVYDYIVFNDGENSFVSVDVADDVCSPLAYTSGDANTNTLLDPGEGWHYTCSAVHTADVTNTFSASGVDALGATVTPEPVTWTVLALDPEIRVVKTVDQSLVYPNTDVTYTYTVTNGSSLPNSTNELHDVALTDPGCSPIVYVSGDTGDDGILAFDGDPATSEVWVYTCTATITASIDSMVTATAEDELGGEVTDTDSEPVIMAEPSLSITKTAGQTSYSTVGDVLTYNLVATNNGNVTLTDVSISDPLLGALTCTQPVILAPTETLVCTGSYTVDQTDLDAGAVDNSADASGSDPLGGPVAANATESVPAAQSASLSLTKTAGQASFSAVGDVLTYTLTATNTGNVTLTAVSITDALLGTLTCSQPVTLAPTETLVCTGSYTVDQADLDLGRVDNSAAASGQPPTGDPVTANATESVPATQSAALSLTKVADQASFSAVGDVLTYTITATNTGNVTLTAVSISDPLLGALACSQPVTLAPTETLVCTGSYTVDQGDLDLGRVDNSADASGSDPLGGPVAANATESVLASQTASMSLTKTADQASYSAVGDVLTYTITATNTGNVTLTAVSISDPLLGALTCTQPVTLQPTETLVCTGSYTVDQGDLDLGGVDNSADASGQPPTGDPVTANAIESVPASQTASLSLDKTAGQASFSAVGDVLTYTITATNTGNVTLTAVSISDPLLGTLVCTQPATLLPGESIACTGSYTVEQADLDLGRVDNSAGTSGQPPVGGPVSDMASASVPATQAAALSLTKVADQAGFSSVGDVLTYTITATNTGNVTLTAVSISDPLLGTLVCTQPATLQPTETLACTGSYTVDQGDLDLGRVDNTAGTSGQPPTGDPVSDRASTSVPATQSASLSLTKTADQASFSAVGDVLTYTLTATNTGNVTLTAVSITDALLGTLTCSQPVTLAPTETLVCTGSYTVDQADLDLGRVDNSAAASAQPPTGDPVTANATESVPAAQSASLSLAKVADQASFSAVGDVLTYTITATNTGNVTLTAVNVNDGLLGTLSCTPTQPATLLPGETLVCTGSYTVDQADLDLGRVDNTAGTSGQPPVGGPVSDTASTSVPASQTPSLALVKTADQASLSAVGDVLTYTIKATNTGNVTLTAVSISDPLLGALTCTQPATLQPTETLVCTGSYTVDQTDLDLGRVDNSADASGQPPTGDPVTANATLSVPASQAASLSLTKVADQPSFSAVGDVVTYTITATNTGNVTLTDVSITDALLGTLVCTQPVTLAPTETLVCTGSYTVDQADLDLGRVDNSADASGQPPTGDPVTANATESVPAAQTTGLSIVKTSDVGPATGVDDIVTYSYLVTNNGNTTVTSLAVTDSMGMTVTCPVTTLAPAASMTCTATYIVTQPDVDAGQLANDATASGTTPTGPTDATTSLTEPLTQSPALGLVKTADRTSFDTAGQTINYAYEVTNTGNVTLTGPITVTDDKVSVTCPTVASLAPGASTPCTAAATVGQPDLQAGSITNTAAAHATFGATAVDSAPSSVTVNAVQDLRLSLTKTATETTFSAVGDVLHYTITATNGGNLTLTGVTVSDPLIADLSCTPAIPASLAPGASIECTGTITVALDDLDRGFLPNTASAAGSGPGGDPATATADHSVPAVQAPALALTKTPTPTVFDDVGQTIDYEYVVTNMGSVTLNGPITVTDDKVTVTCPAVVTLLPGSSTTCTASATVSDADLQAGAITNIAMAHANFGNTTVDSASVDATVTSAATPSLALTKTADPTTFDHEGQTITYTYTLTNDGLLVLDGPFGVTDDKTTVTCEAVAGVGNLDDRLDPGEGLTCTATYAISAADLAAGSVTNTAQGSATDGGGAVTSNTATATVRAALSPHLTLVKTATEGSYSAAGDVLHYTLTATNDGNVVLTGVEITDPLIGNLDCTPAQPVDLAVGEELTCTGAYTVDQDDVDAGAVANTATVAGADPDGQPVTATAGATVTGSVAPHLSLVKTVAQNGYTAVGEILSYTLEATNDGNITLQNVVIVDPRIPGLSCDAPVPAELAVGEKLTCSGTYSVTASDLATGFVLNAATVSGRDPVGYNLSADAEAIVASTLTPFPAIQVVKTASTYGLPAGGGEVTYTYMVLNPGNVPLASVQVTDDRCAPVRYAFGDDGDGALEPGELWTYECTSVLRETTSNTATASADYQGAPIMDDDSVTVWVADPPAPTPSPTPQATVAPTPQPTAPPTTRPTTQSTPRPTTQSTPRPSATLRPTPGPTGGAAATAAPQVTLPPTDRPLPGGRDEPGGMPTLPILAGLGALVVLLLPRWRRVPLDD